ncbi:hypothetical protein T08_1469 [Trichinella sp. T8]|nr:hypothetical protein T08_1469 [Trichinella sp. T8]
MEDKKNHKANNLFGVVTYKLNTVRKSLNSEEAKPTIHKLKNYPTSLYVNSARLDSNKLLKLFIDSNWPDSTNCQRIRNCPDSVRCKQPAPVIHPNMLLKLA